MNCSVFSSPIVGFIIGGYSFRIDILPARVQLGKQLATWPALLVLFFAFPSAYGQTDEMILDVGTYAYEIAGGVIAASVIIAIGIRRYQRKSSRG